MRLGATHLAVIFEESVDHQSAEVEYRTVIGIVTMEDVIEEILQEEIVDETDVISKFHMCQAFNITRIHSCD